MLYKKGSIIEEANNKNQELRKELKAVNDKLDRIRTINLSCTTIAFVMHILGLALTQPAIIIAALSLLMVNVITAPKFFKLMTKAERIQKEIDANKLAMQIGYEQEIFPEFSQLQGLVAIEVREISKEEIRVKPKGKTKENKINNKSR